MWVNAGHWTRSTDFGCHLFNAVIMPNIASSTTTLCLQQSYVGNNAILGCKREIKWNPLFVFITVRRSSGTLLYYFPIV